MKKLSLLLSVLLVQSILSAKPFDPEKDPFLLGFMGVNPWTDANLEAIENWG